MSPTVSAAGVGASTEFVKGFELSSRNEFERVEQQPFELSLNQGKRIDKSAR